MATLRKGKQEMHDVVTRMAVASREGLQPYHVRRDAAESPSGSHGLELVSPREPRLRPAMHEENHGQRALRLRRRLRTVHACQPPEYNIDTAGVEVGRLAALRVHAARGAHGWWLVAAD